VHLVRGHQADPGMVMVLIGNCPGSPRLNRV
jgi:hypothetical protein